MPSRRRFFSIPRFSYPRQVWRPLAPHLALSLSALFAFGSGVPGMSLLVGGATVATHAPIERTNVPVSASRVQESTFWSAALGREMQYAIFVPPGYDSDPSARYPVLYMLHGLGGDYTQWMRTGLSGVAADLMRDGEIPPFIIVLPDGERGYWVDHANNGPRFGSYVTEDLVAFVDRSYRTVPARDARAIGGMSMGGHGALQLALNNPEMFRVVGAHSVALRTKEQAFECFGDRRYFQAHDPVSLIQARPDAARSLVLSIDVGDADPWKTAAAAFHQQLQSTGIPHGWRIAAGGHDGAYWASHAADYLRFYGGALSAVRHSPGG